MSWDQDPFLDPLSNNDLEDTDFNGDFEKGTLAPEEYLKNNPSSNWWLRDPLSERLAAEKLEQIKTEKAQVVQKDSSSPFYDLSDRFEESERLDSTANSKNNSFSVANFSPSYSPNSICDIRGNSFESFKDLEYTDKFTRSPEYDPSIPEPPKKMTRLESVQDTSKKISDIRGPPKGSQTQKALSSETNTSNDFNLNNDPAKKNTGNNISKETNPEEVCTRSLEENKDPSMDSTSTKENSQNDTACDHWGTSTFSWDSPPHVPSIPMASRDSPPRVFSKPAHSWDSPPRVSSKPAHSWDSPPRVPSKPTASWDSPPRVPSKPAPSRASPPRVSSKPSPSWNSPLCVSSKPSSSWNSPPRVSSKPSSSWNSPPRGSFKKISAWNSPPRVSSRPSASRRSPRRVSSKPTSSWNSPPRFSSRSKVGSLPVPHKKIVPFSESSRRPQTSPNASYNSKAKFSSKSTDFYDSKNTNQALKLESGFSERKLFGNSEQKHSYDQVWEDGFLEAATLLLNNIPGAYNNCIDILRKKYPRVIIRDQIKKPRFDSYHPSFVSISENLTKTSDPLTQQPSSVNSNPNDLNINQLNHLRRLQAMESNTSLPHSSDNKNYPVNSVSPGSRSRSNSINARLKVLPSPRSFHNPQSNCNHPHSVSSQRGRPTISFKSQSHNYNHETPESNDSTSFDLLDINTSLVELVMSKERFLTYDSLPNRVRDRVVRLAKEYGLKAHLSGSGAALALKLEKVGGTRIPANTLAIQALLATPLDDSVDIAMLKKMMSCGETQWQGWKNYR